MQTLDKHNAKGNQGENERSQSYFAGILDQINKRFSDFRSEMNTRFSDFRSEMNTRGFLISKQK